MNHYTLTAFAVALGFGVACSSSSDSHAPTLADGGASAKGGTGGRTSAGKSGGGGRSEGGNAGEADEGGAAGGDAAGAGGEGGLEPGMIIPVTPGSCSQTAAWASAAPLAVISSEANEQLLAITADELDVLFLRDSLPMRAHRELAGESFGEPVALDVPSGYGLSAGAALSADGLTLVLLETGGQGFAAFTRASRAESFGTTPDASSFTGLNQRALQTMQHYAAPVLAPDGKRFVFAAFTPEPEAGFPTGFAGTSVVYESTWSMSGWSMPESISQNLFDGTTAARALPSGLASDSRTLFYLDEASGTQKARFRDRPDAPLYTVVDLAERTGAVPDAKCDRLYYSSNGDVLIGSR